MSSSVVWLDFENAKLFHFSDDQMKRETLHASMVEHHTHRLNADEKDNWNFYEKIALSIESAKRVLILGPGIAKTHFENYMKGKHPLTAKKVVGCESSDHPTDQQIAAFAMKYFNKQTVR
ncbi:MAG: hypothetical protein KA715_09310 [Xanthomonadaceae bacterium]|nr:hypothetical protein [Xanthomonadaceae bacterium]